MQDDIRFKGYVSVILVMDLKPFIESADRQRFETIRGYREFADVLKEKWPRQLANSAFEPVDLDVMGVGRSATMSTDEVGFVTGIFRLNMLDLYSSPIYRVNKARVPLPQPVKNNLQYQKLLEPIWKDWDIYLRPTMTGMMVIRLERRYDKAVGLLKAASHVIELQTPFDVPSAIQALGRLQAKVRDPKISAHEQRETQSKLNDTRGFLEWLGVTNLEAPELDYIPVQWQLASELSRQLMRDVGSEIRLRDKSIRFSGKKPDLSTSLYDVYTIYHVDDLLVHPTMIKPPAFHDPDEQEDDTPQPASAVTDTSEMRLKSTGKSLQSVSPSEIKRSIRIKWGLVGLIEGAILSKKASSGMTNRRFPRHNLGVVNQVFDQDIATWSDELCVLTSRTAIIMPSRKASREQLFVSKLDAKTTSTYVDYLRYWEALERLIEFVNEISILAQLVENDSADTLQQFVHELDRARRNILKGQLNGTLIDSQRNLTELTNQSANLSRLVGLCQGLINPNFWSRAEYAVEKANHLIREMQTALLVSHAERNISNLTNLVDHVDELYLAQLSENSNAQNSRQSIILAGLSLSIILFTLPSFWADINQLNTVNGVINFIRQSDFLTALAVLGSILAPLIFLGSILVAVSAAMPARYRFWRRLLIRRRVNGKEQEMLVEESILEEGRARVEENRLRRRLPF